MNLERQVMEQLKQAMLAKNEGQLRGLRAIKAAILLEKTAKETEEELSKETEIKLLQKLVKQRNESLKIYEEQKRNDLAEKEKEEIAIIQQFLPKEMPAEEIEAIVNSIIQEQHANSMADMGKVMGAASKKLAGKTSNQVISEIVKRKLSS